MILSAEYIVRLYKNFRFFVRLGNQDCKVKAFGHLPEGFNLQMKLPNHSAKAVGWLRLVFCRLTGMPGALSVSTDCKEMFVATQYRKYVGTLRPQSLTAPEA